MRHPSGTTLNAPPADAASPLHQPFGHIGALVRAHAQTAPHRAALLQPGAPDEDGDGLRRMDYGTLDAWMDSVASALQREGLGAGDSIAICALSSIEYAAVFLGALRVGVVVAPLPPGSTTAVLQRMVQDAGARWLFLDAVGAEAFGSPWEGGPQRVMLDGRAGGTPLAAWRASEGAPRHAVDIAPGSPFNIIYSSGTTGEPKGIVQSHRMRWAHMQRGLRYGYEADSVAVLSTPLYSNTTLVIFFPALAFGGAVLVIPKFHAEDYLRLCERHHATHTMLVPVQYRRLLALPSFDQHDLGHFVMKFCTSAPFSAALKADVLKRWPGGLVEYYGMTEGGASCILEAHLYPHKLHTVGPPASGSDVRMIDEEGRELPRGEIGEIVGSGAGMMIGYHGRPEATRAAEWHDARGQRFIRTGDVGRFDEDGFVVLGDRKKDMIISGGFNIYPSDIEDVLATHPAVLECAVVAMPSEQWGESPAAFVVLRPGQVMAAQALRDWLNARVDKVQRLAWLGLLPELPRSAIGKVLKRELREQLTTR